MKDRIFVVRVTKHYNKGLKKVSPFISVSYTDANDSRHLMETFADKEENVGLVAGELMHRLIPQLGSK